MKYEETICVEKDDEYQEIIKLYDLNQELVVDYINEPGFVRLIDMDSREVISKFQYGDGDLEGFSFAVSPRHNYPIVKECREGISLDDLYATIYCLKDKENFEPHNPSQYGPLKSHRFHSHYHLTFMFSNDSEESTVWLSGQEVSDLNVIDVLEYGDFETTSLGKNAKVAKFYQLASYPLVKLSKRIRDRIGNLQFNDRDVVNSLEKIEQQQHRKFCGFKIEYGFDKAVSSLLRSVEYSRKLYLNHTLLTSNKFKRDSKSLRNRLQCLGLEARLIKNTIDSHEYEYIVLSTPMVNQSSFIVQSIAQVSQTCEEFGVIYEGFTFSELSPLESWDDAIKSSLKNYQFLCEALTRKDFSLDQFTSLFYQLYSKHNKTGFEEFFSEKNNDSIEHIKVSLSRFNDWDIKEEKLRKIIEAYVLEKR